MPNYEIIEKSKSDPKVWIIIVLFLFCAIFATAWFFQGSSNKKERKRLEKENKVLQEKRDSINDEFLKLKETYKKDSLILVKTKKDMDDITRLIKSKDVEITKAKNELINFKSGFTKSKGEIEKLKKEPIKRTGNNLLESIKEKTK